MSKVINMNAYKKANRQRETLTGMNAIFMNANGKDLEKYPEGRPCKIIRKCEDDRDPFLREHNITELAPCYLIEMTGEEEPLIALTEEVTLIR